MLYDAFGQRQVSTMYTSLNQYHVVMEVAPQFWQNPDTLRLIYVQAPNGQEVPLSAFTHFAPSTAPLSVNHQGLFPAVTISFNLAPGAGAGRRGGRDRGSRADGRPAAHHSHSVRRNGAGVSGFARQRTDADRRRRWSTVYIVLGMLYESYIHPITILSTLPSAGVGALLALFMLHTELSIIAHDRDHSADRHREEERHHDDRFRAGGRARSRAIARTTRSIEACLLRFRPILMTTMAAMLGALPLALGNGTGSELRRPLGITIIGGLIVSQLLTLYTTPVVYLELDRLRLRFTRGHHAAPLEPVASET